MTINETFKYEKNGFNINIDLSKDILEIITDDVHASMKASKIQLDVCQIWNKAIGETENVINLCSEITPGNDYKNIITIPGEAAFPIYKFMLDNTDKNLLN